METDYPNPYGNTDYPAYQNPYEVDNNGYEGENGSDYSGGEPRCERGYNGRGYDDSYDAGCRQDDGYDSQDSRDRNYRKNRTERRREQRDGDRDYDHPRERHRDRDDWDDSPRGRDRDRDRGRDGGRERGYDNPYDARDRDRGREERGRDDRLRDDRSRDRGDRDDRDRRRDSYDPMDDRAGEKWKTEMPTNTVILQGLPYSIEEKDIKAELMFFGAPIKDVRLMRKSTGSSRGFAFVEFQNNDDALRWMETNQHTLVLQNQYKCHMSFSTPKNSQDRQIIHKVDWTCIKCGVHNFKRRDYCFKCNMSRYESEKQQMDGFDQVGTNPCNTILFRGLDALTTEENLTHALNAVSALTCKNIGIIRDPNTSESLGYGFVELPSVAESMNVLELLKGLNTPFEVDGKQILVSFAKNTFNTTMTQIQAAFVSAATAASQSWDQTGEYPGYDYGQSGYDQTAAGTAGYYESGGQYDYSSYYSQPGDTSVTAATTGATVTATTTTSTTTANVPVDSTNAAAAVAQAAIQQAQAAKNYQKKVQKIAEMTEEERLVHEAKEWKKRAENLQKSINTENNKYPPPDVSLYQYDETSGYYYDPVTTLYYDSNSQYYYNGTTGQFLYWNAEQSTYLPAPSTPDGLPKPPDGKEDKKEGKDKKEKNKVAKKIAKDMEKWAKMTNAQKEAMSKKISLPMLGKKDDKGVGAVDVGFSILEKTKTGTLEDKKLMPPPPLPGGGPPQQEEAEAGGLVASYGGDSDDEEEEPMSEPVPGVDEAKLVDLAKLACLLCKRQFQNKDSLQRHTQMSDLHKKNLEALQGSQSTGDSSSQQYRDRAKERRAKFGTSQPPELRKRPQPPPEPYEQPTKKGLGQDNIGSKMLEKMGWSAGQGLGRKGQGIVDPITAERRNQAAGLGMKGAAMVNLDDAENYKEAAKKTLFSRFNDMD